MHHAGKSSASRTANEQQNRQVVQEQATNPGRHSVGSWTAKIPIDDDHGAQNRYAVHDEREQQVFRNQGKHQRSWRKYFGYEQHEHDERQKNGNAQRHFLTCLVTEE